MCSVYFRYVIPRSVIIIHKPSDRFTPSVLLVFLLAIVSYLQASDDKLSPFSTSDVSMEIGRISSIGDLNEFWSAGSPAGLSIALPFYFGIVEAGTQIIRFHARHNQVPDFQTQYFFIGWGLRKSLISNLSVFGGVRLGNQLMTVAGIRRHARYESELGTESSLGLGIKIFPHWTVHVTVRRQRIYTQVPLIFDFGSISVSYRLPTPDWLRDFLE